MFTAEPPRRHRGALSLRERQVVNLAALGLSDRQISEQMSVTLGTMAAYWARVRSKLDVRNRLQATTLLNHQRTGRIVTDLVKCLPHAQEAARTSASRSHQVLEHELRQAIGPLRLETFVWFTDPLGTVRFVNDAMVKSQDRDQADLIGRPVGQLFSRDRQGVCQRAQFLLARGICSFGHLQSARRDGAVVCFDAALCPVVSSTGEFLGGLGVGAPVADLSTRESLSDELRLRAERG